MNDRNIEMKRNEKQKWNEEKKQNKNYLNRNFNATRATLCGTKV